MCLGSEYRSKVLSHGEECRGEAAAARFQARLLGMMACGVLDALLSVSDAVIADFVACGQVTRARRAQVELVMDVVCACPCCLDMVHGCAKATLAFAFALAPIAQHPHGGRRFRTLEAKLNHVAG